MNARTGTGAHIVGRRALHADAAQCGFVLLFFCLLAIGATWPVVTELRTTIIGRESDAFVDYWVFHWIEDRVRAGRFTFFTDRLFYPVGVSLLNQNVAWLNAALWLVVKPIVSSLPAFSLLAIGLIAFNGVAVFLLVRDLTGSWEASVVAGSIALLWPSVLDRSFQVNTLPIGFVAMALRALGRLIETGCTSDAVRLSVWLGLTGILRVQMLILGAWIWMPYALIRLAQVDLRTGWQRIQTAFLAGGLGALISLPFALPFIVYQLGERDPGDLVHSLGGGHVSDLACYFLPRKGHLLLSGVTETLVGRHDLRLSLNAPSLGWVALGLVVVAWAFAAHRVWIWGVLALFLLVPALGPRPHLFGLTVDLGPYTRAYEAIALPLVREPDRFDLLLAIPVSVMAGWGVSEIVRRLRPVALRRLIVLAAIPLVFLDSVVLPHPHMRAEVPAWYDGLADDPDDYGLLEIPMCRECYERYMLSQLVHHKGLVYGHVSRVPKSAYRFIDSVPLLAHLHDGSGDAPPLDDFDLGASLDALHDAGVRYMVLHRGEMSEALLAQWRRWLVVSPIYSDAALIVYRTDWRDQMAGMDRPRAQQGPPVLLDYALTPTSTVPGGWVEVTVAWYVPEGASAPRILTLVDDKKSLVQMWPKPDPQNSADVRAEDGIVWRTHRVQVSPDTQPGAYVLCFTDDAEGDGPGAIDDTLCQEFTVAARARTFSRPESGHSLDVTFGDMIGLRGFDTSFEDARLQLQFVWRAERKMTASYKVFVHVIDVTTGALVAQKDFVPRDWTYPTTYWRAGEYVEDAVVLDLRAIADGSYDVQVGLYHAGTGERLATVPPHPNDAVVLIRVER